jgi:hypothetical protein
MTDDELRVRVSPHAVYLAFHEWGRDPREEHEEQFRMRPFLAGAFQAVRDDLANTVDADPPKLPALPPPSDKGDQEP